MNSKIISTTFATLLLMIIVQAESASTLKCYSCFFDTDYPHLKNSDKDCQLGNITTTIMHPAGCVYSVFQRQDKIVSVFRGGIDATSFQTFAKDVRKSPADYFKDTCFTDMCNGALSTTGGIAMMVAAIAILAAWPSL